MLVIGHRGAKGLAPENTILGLEKALQHGADAVEVDVHITKDGIPVLTHNADTADAAGNLLRVADATYAELKAHKADLPTLEAAIAYLNRRIPIIIEVKPGESTAPVIAVVESFRMRGWQASDIHFISFDFQVLKELRAAFPDHILIVDEMWSSVRAHWRAYRLGTKHISLYTPFLWNGFVKMVSRRGWQLYAFPLNDTAKASRWAKLGFAGAITDFPDRFESPAKSTK